MNNIAGHLKASTRDAWRAPAVQPGRNLPPLWLSPHLAMRRAG